MELLNTDRFEEVKTVLRESGISLSEENQRCIANVFEIISAFVHEKLTLTEILRTYDLLSDVIKNKRPDIILYVSKEDRIRVAVRLMEELPETRGKLTEEEKVAFAFCIFTGECIQFYDEERGMIRSGTALFDTFEHIEEKFQCAMEEDPERFDMKKAELVIDDQYGFSIDTAIHVTSVGAAYEYLDRLRYHGKPVIYQRIGSSRSNAGQIIDRYTVYIEKNSLFSKKRTEVATLYINSYCQDMPFVAPKGFSLV